MAAELERQGISTVTLSLLREVTEQVRPPRALFVPFPHGYPLDTPGDPGRQHAVIEAALRLLEGSSREPPVLADYHPKEIRETMEGLSIAYPDSPRRNPPSSHEP